MRLYLTFLYKFKSLCCVILLSSCSPVEEEKKVVSKIGESEESKEMEFTEVDINLREKETKIVKEYISEGAGFQLSFNLLTDSSGGEFDVYCSDEDDFISGNIFDPNIQTVSESPVKF